MKGQPTFFDKTANSGTFSKQSLPLQANQTNAIAGIPQGIKRVVDHTGGVMEGSARNATLAQSVMDSLGGISHTAPT